METQKFGVLTECNNEAKLTGVFCRPSSKISKKRKRSNIASNENDENSPRKCRSIPRSPRPTPPANKLSALRPKKTEVAMLLESVPVLQESLDVVQKIGEGTFSCVYLAKLKTPSKKYVALKHIPTSSPKRIIMELSCLRKLGGRCNVMGIHTCLRFDNHVVLIMPYFPHDNFSDLVSEMSIEEITDYIRNLLTALKFIHSAGVIHRDVKPSNFLCNRAMQKYALVDFGLAQLAKNAAPTDPIPTPEVEEEECRENEAKTVLPDEGSETLKASKNAFYKLLPPTSASGGCSKVTSRLQLSILGRSGGGGKGSEPLPPPGPPGSSTIQSARDATMACECYRKPQVCRICLRRKPENAYRAGTPGFRAPEVLLKHQHQGTALDVWSAGVILLSLLSGRFPFFHAADDITALAEITSVVGSQAIKRTARKMGKTVLFGCERSPPDLKTLCDKLRPKAVINEGKHSDDDAESNNQKWTLCHDLLKKLLDADPGTRVSAANALNHPLFS